LSLFSIDSDSSLRFALDPSIPWDSFSHRILLTWN
jgi:hypothetical protein